MAKKAEPVASKSDEPGDVLSDLIKGLNTTFKEKVASRADESTLVEPLDWIPTGIDELDFAFNADPKKSGIPTSRVIELYGSESKGKSALSMQIAKATQAYGGIAIVLDSESSFDKDFSANVLGVNLEKMGFIDTPSMEDGFERIDSLVDGYLANEYKTPMLIIWDTIAAAPTRNELAGDTYGGGIASKPRGLSEFFRRITPRLSRTRISLLLLNQIRSSLGQGSDDSPGGWALRHHTGVRIQAKSGAEGRFIKDDSGKVVGINASFKFVKNKVGVPMREVNIPFYFDTGFDNAQSLVDSALVLSANGVETGVYKSSNGWYKTLPPQPDDKQIRYKDLVTLLRTDVELSKIVRENIRKIRQARR